MIIHFLSSYYAFNCGYRHDDLILRIKTKIKHVLIRNSIIFLAVDIGEYWGESNTMIYIEVDILLYVNCVFQIN